jgi:hypothetical protein
VLITKIINERYPPTTYMFVKAGKSQPEATRPAKPGKSCLYFIKRKQKEKVIVFILELFKNNIKNNFFV